MTGASDGLVARRVLPLALERLVDDPVLLLKTPVSRKVHLAAQHRSMLRSRGHRPGRPPTRDAVAADPTLFVPGSATVCIDELTGSTRHNALPAAAQSLTGQLSRLTVYHLSQGEIAETNERLLEHLFTNPAEFVAAVPTSTTTREGYITRLVSGGFPIALARSSPAARYGGRDVQELSSIRQGSLLPNFVQRLAGQTAQVLNIDRAARDAGLDHSTGESYARLLEAVFLIHRLPAWGKTLSSRAAATPKVHVLDSGVSARLLRMTPEKLARRDAASLTASWLDGIAGAGHWRTRDGDKVDLVLERDDGAVLAFEVKASGRVPGNDLKPLRKLRTATGEAFLAGITRYTGSRSYNVENRLYVKPVDRLWQPGHT